MAKYLLVIWSNNTSLKKSNLISNHFEDYCYRDMEINIPDDLIDFATIWQGNYVKETWFNIKSESEYISYLKQCKDTVESLKKIKML